MLSPAQEAEAWRFAQERIAAQLSTEPVDRVFGRCTKAVNMLCYL
jgi:hypothetical protein